MGRTCKERGAFGENGKKMKTVGIEIEIKRDKEIMTLGRRGLQEVNDSMRKSSIKEQFSGREKMAIDAENCSSKQLPCKCFVEKPKRQTTSPI